MSINSRNKGNTYELKIAKKLSSWWGVEFRRVPLSGGFDKRLAVGDLWIVDKTSNIEEVKKFPFAIECKNRESWNWNILFGFGNSELNEYWKQACKDAEELQKIPLLIFTKNRIPDFIMWGYGDLPILSNSFPITIISNHDFRTVCIMMLEDWIKIYNKEVILRG